MNPPGIGTRIVGHGLVQAASLGGFLWGLYAGFNNGVGPVPALLCLLAMHIAHQAGEKVRAYRFWKMEWDALAPSQRIQRRVR